MPAAFGIPEVEAFVRIVECGSFRQAAAEMRLTQSALTQRLKKLEAALGARLVDRTTRAVAPTAIGRSFLPSARRLLQQFEETAAGIRGVIEVAGGQVTIASLISVATYALPPVLKGFAERHPRVGVRILDESEQEIVQHLRSGEAEFAVDMLTGPVEPDLTATPLTDDPFVLACREDHPLAGGGPVAWAALSDMPVIALGSRSGTSRVVNAQLAAQGRSPAWRHEVQHLSTLVGLLEAGLGVGIVPGMAMAGLSGHRLVARPLTEPAVARRLVLLERRGATLSPAAVALRSMVVEALAGRAVGG
jgi:DNA-binding transcriptional LysR family regulator